MTNIELVGYAAGFVMSIALLPQLAKALKTKSTKDISVLWTLVVMLGLSLWIAYATFNKIMPLLIFASIEFLLISLLFALKLKYK